MKKVITIVIISVLTVSCLMPPPPRFYNYSLIENNTNSNTLLLKNLELTTVYTGNRYLWSTLHIKLLTLNNTELNINAIDFNSKVFKSDSLDIKLIPNEKTITQNNPIEVEPNDTLNLVIFFMNKNRKNGVKRKAFLNLKKTDTTTINLEVNNQKYRLLYK
jgi:hypothetical protein